MPTECMLNSFEKKDLLNYVMLNLKHYQATKNASTLCEIITFHLKICRDYAIT